MFRGANDERFGPRFFPTNHVYSDKALQKARQVKIRLLLYSTGDKVTKFNCESLLVYILPILGFRKYYLQTEV